MPPAPFLLLDGVLGSSGGRVLEALVIAAVLAMAGALTRLVRVLRSRETAQRAREAARDDKIGRILEGFEGAPANRYTGQAALPGIGERLGALEEQLGRNGGTTVGDAVARTEHHVAEIRVLQLAQQEVVNAVARRVERTEGLVVQHLADGRVLLSTGLANDAILWAALRAHGIEIADPFPFPEVDFGEGYEDVPTEPTTDPPDPDATAS
jgi:hypothetical protein